MTRTKAASTSILPVSEIEQYRQTNTALIRQSQDFAIKTSGDENTVYDVLRNIAGTKKAIEKRRLEITGPLNKSLKAANSLFKELTAPLLDADAVLRGKIVAFRAKQEAQAEKMRERRLEKAAEAEAAGDQETALAFEEEAEAVQAKVGGSVLQKRWTFDVVDADGVPREYLEINTVAVNEAIREGVRDIPGLRIYQKELVSVR